MRSYKTSSPCLLDLQGGREAGGKRREGEYEAKQEGGVGVVVVVVGGRGNVRVVSFYKQQHLVFIES